MIFPGLISSILIRALAFIALFIERLRHQPDYLYTHEDVTWAAEQGIRLDCNA